MLKHLIAVAFFVTLLVPTLEAQNDRGNSRSFWRRPVQVQSTNIRPVPTSGDQMLFPQTVNGNTRYRPGTVTEWWEGLQDSSKFVIFPIEKGGRTGRTDLNGHFTIPHTIGDDSVIPIVTNRDTLVPFIFSLFNITDTTVVMKAFYPGGATASDTTFTVSFVIVDDVEGI